MLQVSTIYNLLCAVHTLHNQRKVHCDLQPIHFGWFNEQQQWKLLGLATWTHVGAARNPGMCYTLRYAAPEVHSITNTAPCFKPMCCLYSPLLMVLLTVYQSNCSKSYMLLLA